MRFFAKFVFVCNICFLASVILRFIELSRRTTGNLDSAIPFQPLESTIIVLGYSAIFFSVAFFCVFMYKKLRRKPVFLPACVVMTNLLMLPVQVWYFFFTNF